MAGRVLTTPDARSCWDGEWVSLSNVALPESLLCDSEGLSPDTSSVELSFWLRLPCGTGERETLSPAGRQPLLLPQPGKRERKRGRPSPVAWPHSPPNHMD